MMNSLMTPVVVQQAMPHVTKDIFVDSVKAVRPPMAENPPATNQTTRRNGSSRYKTELCRPFQETGYCRYGDRCQFSHGDDELRTMPRHPKYKTELCKTYHVNGFCPYGQRCHFIHDEDLQKLFAIRSRQREYALKQQVQRLVEQKEKEVITALVLQQLRANMNSADPRQTLSVNPGFIPIGLDSQGQSPRSSFSGSPQPVISPTSPPQQQMSAFTFDQHYMPLDVNTLQQSLAQLSLCSGNNLPGASQNIMPAATGLYPSSQNQGMYSRMM